MYAGAVVATVAAMGSPLTVTVRSSSYSPAEPDGTRRAAEGSVAADEHCAAVGPDEQAWVDWTRGGMGEGRVEVDMASARGPAVLAAAFAPKREAAGASDPTMDRAYGILP